ncbi:N-acetyltransferase [Luminiphilus sp.]|nr:N-acetyltransferase [Luminiphilus sp.]
MTLIHETAVIDEGVSLGDGTKVWHFSHVSEGAQIGENCSLGQNVFIGRNVKIGSNCRIQNNVSVYENVVLADDVFCGPSMVFTNVYNPRSSIPRKDSFLNTSVEQGATFGANCTIVCGVSIGSYAFVGAGAVVNQSVLDYALVVGVPARHIGWMSRFGEQIPLPLSGSGSFSCNHTGDYYRLTGDRMQLVEA